MDLGRSWYHLTARAVEKAPGAGLPPVELIQFEDTYCVRDGHHRISVAKTLGQAEIEAQIVYKLVGYFDSWVVC